MYCLLERGDDLPERLSEPVESRAECVEGCLSDLLRYSSSDNCCGLVNFSFVLEFRRDRGLSKFALFRFSPVGVVGLGVPLILPPLFLLSARGVPLPPKLSSLLCLGAEPK